MPRIDFTTITDPGHACTTREYLYSRINRGIAANQLSGTARPMKITNLYPEFNEVRIILRDLAAAGANRLAEVTREHLDQVLAGWKRCPDSAAGLVGVVRHLAAHGEFLTDRLIITPWPGRPASQIAGRRIPRENTTARIPEDIIAPLLKSALFYVETASGDLLAARAEIAALEQARTHHQPGSGSARTALAAFIGRRRLAGRGLPALPW
jgi:hypothetical protein